MFTDYSGVEVNLPKYTIKVLGATLLLSSLIKIYLRGQDHFGGGGFILMYTVLLIRVILDAVRYVFSTIIALQDLLSNIELARDKKVKLLVEHLQANKSNPAALLMDTSCGLLPSLDQLYHVTAYLTTQEVTDGSSISVVAEGSISSNGHFWIRTAGSDDEHLPRRLQCVFCLDSKYSYNKREVKLL